MREIKYEAWDVENEKMYRVIEISWDKDGSMHGLVDCKGSKELGRVFLGRRTLVDEGNPNHPEGLIDDFKLREFTGLRDKNEKEIYEGDIIINRDGTWEVKYIDDFACFYMVYKIEMQRLDMCGRSNEVIGNIYENKKLLEKKDE